jgi:hypothetical protein
LFLSTQFSPFISRDDQKVQSSAGLVFINSFEGIEFSLFLGRSKMEFKKRPDKQKPPNSISQEAGKPKVF